MSDEHYHEARLAKIVPLELVSVCQRLYTACNFPLATNSVSIQGAYGVFD